MTDRELMQQVVTARERYGWGPEADEAIYKLRDRLARQEQDDMNTCNRCGKRWKYQHHCKAAPPPAREWMKPHPKCDEACLYQCTEAFTRFPKCAARKWQGLSEAELYALCNKHRVSSFREVADAIEAKLKEKNA